MFRKDWKIRGKLMAIMRKGKTEKDRRSGKHERTQGNKAEREAWMKGIEKEFPKHTCNGKKNRR